MSETQTFEQELERLINKHSKESGSNTPDYILVEYMTNCLNNFHQATRLRDNWYGGKRSVINDQAEKWAEAPKQDSISNVVNNALLKNEFGGRIDIHKDGVEEFSKSVAKEIVGLLHYNPIG